MLTLCNLLPGRVDQRGRLLLRTSDRRAAERAAHLCCGILWEVSETVTIQSGGCLTHEWLCVHGAARNARAGRAIRASVDLTLVVR